MRLEKADWSFNMAENTQRKKSEKIRQMPAEEKAFDERVVYVNRVARVVKAAAVSASRH
jgi:ribosomal protein S5